MVEVVPTHRNKHEGGGPARSWNPALEAPGQEMINSDNILNYNWYWSDITLILIYIILGKYILEIYK